MKKIFLILFTLMLFGAAYAQDSKVNKSPDVIPSIRNWMGGSGSLSLGEELNIVVSKSDYKILKRVLDNFQESLNVEFAKKSTISQTYSKRNVNFVFEMLDRDTFTNDEEYIVSINENNVEIKSSSKRGIIWAIQTISQMLVQNSRNLVCGLIRDYPDYTNRGFMLDVGRKFFSIDYLRDYIKILSYDKFNEFQIHLNDNGFIEFFDNDWNKTYSAFRLESNLFPELTAKDGYYTKQEFRDLQKMGKDYGINVIPEIDIPAHSLAFSHFRKKLGSSKYGQDHLDLYNPSTYSFLDSLFREYICGENPVFIGDDIHIGTDEYDAAESEKYREFTDRYLRYIQSLGKNVRMWGGLRWLKGKTPVLSDGVVINAWSYDWVDPVKSLSDGYKIISSCDTWLYIVPAAGYYRDFLDSKWLYENWKPEMVNSRELLPDGQKGLLGGMFAVWNDHCGNGISQKDVHIRSLSAVRVLSERMWKRVGKEEKYTYQDFILKANNQIDAPTVNLSGRTQTIGDLNGISSKEKLVLKYSFSDNKIIDLSGNMNNAVRKRKLKRNRTDASYIFKGNSSLQTPIKEIGYDYSISFDLKQYMDNTANAVLFANENTKVLLNTKNTGKIGFSREGYTYFFDYIPEDNIWYHIEIKGDYKGTSLLVNGKLIDRLEGEKKLSSINKHGRRTNMYIQQTLFFPLEKIGDLENGFKGEIRNLSVKQKLFKK